MHVVNLTSLAVAKTPRDERKVIDVLVELITEVYDADDRAANALWFQEKQWLSGRPHVSQESLKHGFEFLLAGPLMFEPSIQYVVAHAIIHCLFNRASLFLTRTLLNLTGLS